MISGIEFVVRIEEARGAASQAGRLYEMENTMLHPRQFVDVGQAIVLDVLPTGGADVGRKWSKQKLFTYNIENGRSAEQQDKCV